MKAVRFLLPGLVGGALFAAAMLPAIAQGSEPFAIGNFVATNCKASFEGCGAAPAPPGPYSEPLAKVTTGEAEEQGFTEAGGRVPLGVTDFAVKPKEGSISTGNAVPSGIVTHVRTDVAPGLATNPEAIPHCTSEEFGKEALPHSNLFEEPKCPTSTEIGENKVLVYIAQANADVEIPQAPETNVYNLVQPEGLKTGQASSFGVALKLPIFLTKGELEAEFAAHPLPEEEFPGTTVEKEAEKKGTEAALEAKQYWAHTLIEGNVEWGKEIAGTDLGDFHDYFEIEVSPSLPLVRSRLVFKGTVGTGDFITNATSCPGHNTTTLTLTDSEGATSRKEFTTPIGLSGCEGLKFEPGFALTPETTANDQPDAFTAAASEPHEANKPDQAQVKSASFTLPAGMTLNPSAAKGLEDCTPKQAHQEGAVFGPQFGVECPAASKIGTVSLNVPTLPNGSLTGSVYLAGPETGAITAPPYMVYVVANSERYRLSVRLIGEVVPNEVTGQVTTYFRNPPEQPFSSLAIHFERGALAPIANPLSCGPATAMTSFTPFSGTAAQSPISGFVVDSNGSGGTCGASILALTQSTSSSSSTADAYTSYALNLQRGDGQQYLTKVSTTLPEGLLGAIPSLTLCGEAEANAVNCPANSKIGTATIKAGAGSEPYTFAGQVFMTGPYSGAPYGLEIVVPTAAGPFNFGNEVVRATVSVNPSTTQITVTANVPTIKDGIPLRIKGMTVAVEREKFLFNPTNCNVLATVSSLSGTPTLPAVSGASQGIPTPFQVNGCSSLPFKPTFSASTSAKTSKANGASLNVKVGYPAGPQANIKAVRVELPKQLPSRLTTLNKACVAAQFESNPAGCPAASDVGTATATTPVLPGKLAGPAYLVSHGSAAFPDLEIVLSGDNVTVILDGQTNIKNGITSSTFSAIPDDPVSAFELNLPTGKYSVFTANGNVCAQALAMPTVIEGQNGAKITQSTKITVTGCGVVITAHKVKSRKVKVTVVTPAAGRVSASGKYLKTVKRTLGKAGKATLTVSLSKKGIAALQRSKKGKLKVKVTVGFRPTKGSTSKASVAVTFKR